MFGGPVRPPMAADRAVRKLAELGAYGVNFHDNDVFAFDASPAERDERIAAFRKALDETGVVVTTATTNLFGHPMFKDGAFTANERAVRRFALAKVMRNLDLAAELGAKTYVFWGGREGAESGAAKDIRAALDRYAEGLNLLSEYVIDQGYDIRFAIEPKPNEPRGDILLPIDRARARVHQRARAPGPGRRQPGDRPRGDGGAQLRARHRPGACGTASCSTSTSTARHGPRYDQDLRFGAGNARGAFWVVDTLLAGGYDGPVHFDYKPPRTEDDEGVWASAAACMRNYLILREKATRVPRRPRGPGGPGRRPRRRARRADPGPRRDLARRPRRDRRTSTRSPPAAWPTSTWTSSRWSTSTASASPVNRARPHGGPSALNARQHRGPLR